MINFFNEDVDFRPTNPIKTKRWINGVINRAGAELNEINYIFCSDEYLLDINKEHLNHDYFTDIITFDNSEEGGVVEADIFISIDRVKENAKNENKAFEDEMRRVLIHGVLHLLGFEDSSEELKKKMREEEDKQLALFH
jgi:probable rRNA maturation factor